MNISLRGSKWRRWELHTHTPASHLNNGYGDNWDSFVKELFSRALRYDIAAIGLTDYFTIDGYKKVKTGYLDNDTKLRELFTTEELERIKNILVVPNIEFRLNHLVDGNRVNFHVIFSDQVPISDIEENFLHELSFVSESTPQAEDETWKLKHSNLQQLGMRLKAEHKKFSAESDICVGMKCAVVNDKEITKTLTSKQSKFKGKYLIFTPSDEDLSKISWDGQGHLIRKTLIQKSDGLMASNKNTIKWGLGKLSESPEAYIDEFKSLKPCIWGADAHCFDTMFSPAKNNFCWIKANPSFNGLKQVIYEPEDRVKIQEFHPDNKKAYQLIDSVNFSDSNFAPEPILINSNLTAIIGGKSTGKSILLRSIAKTIDFEEVKQRLKDAQLPDYSNKIDGFKVNWRDSQTQTMADDNGVRKKIIYIPQSYFNRLVDNPESKTSIDTILTNVLEQTIEIKKCFAKFETHNREVKRNISETIENVFFTLEDWKKQQSKIREIGDKIGITKEVESLAKIIETLKSNSGMSEDEILKYNQATTNIENIRRQNKELSTDIQVLTNLKELSFTQIDSNKLSTVLRTKVDLQFTQLTHELRAKWSTYLDEKISETHKTINNNARLLDSENKSITPYIDKINNTKSLKEHTQKHDAELLKLTAIKLEEESLEQLASKYREESKRLSELTTQYHTNLKEVQNTVSGLREVKSDIKLTLSVDFKTSFFQKKFVEEVCNLRQLSKFTNVSLVDFNWLNNEQFKNDISSIIFGILDESITLKNNYTKKEAITKLLQNWFIINYHVTYKGDELSEMSPGKKSFVLLKLLLDLDNSTCPLLIDQPEDDLDNRSIYNELVSYIKNSKKNRQIIIATHNPNLVVAADAEEVIVANQHGEESLNETYQFEYISNALEDTHEHPDLKFTLKKQGIKEHVCDILEGGELAFQKRSEKYNIVKE